MTTYPWLLYIRIPGAEFYRLVWSTDFEAACLTVSELYPGCSIENATINA